MSTGYRPLALVALLALAGAAGSAQGRAAPIPPDDRFKADLLLMVAHPDDDVLAGTYLARAVLDDGRRVAVVFMTSGDSGGNEAGPERGGSLGMIRQIEARQDLATLGITHVWFLGGHDTPGQDPVRSLANWGHGQVLADAVRLVRLTRPDVVLTWLPMQVVGENHGDHQAASIVATEAFDMAGDATVFAEQVAASVQRFESRLEGLRPWQPKKLYFMSDALDTRFMDGHGPSYSVKAVSKARGVPFWQLATDQLNAHVTQYKSMLAQLASMDAATRERVAVSDVGGDALIEPLRLVRGKSLVGGTAAGDVFEGVTGPAIPFTPAPGWRPPTSGELTLEAGGPWRFYREFWQAHALPVAMANTAAIGPVGAGSQVPIPLLIANGTDRDVQVQLAASLPSGWQEHPRSTAVLVPARSQLQVTSVVTASSAAAGATRSAARYDVTYTATAGGTTLAPLTVRVVVTNEGNDLPR